ncbi:MAG: type II toxin-antitoxin system VapC family toxin [Deltaproteobacteria bacterium]|nr:type II toxin-antitoxin system VapC family toxin [Deltaproteobacteria bacterium]
MYLLDTNIILELFLDQQQADKVERFLQQAPADSLHLTEFSLYSLGVVLFRLKSYDAFLRALDDLLHSGVVNVIRLETEDLPLLADAARNFGLDFDDSYQYVAAEKHDFTLVSFDRDFERTIRGRKTLDEIMN